MQIFKTCHHPFFTSSFQLSLCIVLRYRISCIIFYILYNCFVAGNECFMATGPDIIVFSPYMVGDTVFKEYNLTTGKACDTLVLASTAMLQASVSSALLYIFYFCDTDRQIDRQIYFFILQKITDHLIARRESHPQKTHTCNILKNETKSYTKKYICLGNT